METKSLFTGLLAFIMAIASLVIITGCEKDEFNEASLNEYLKSMPPISSEMPAEKDAEIVGTKDSTGSEYYYHYDYYEAAAGYDEQIVLNPQTDVIYPGALIKGESILDGTYTMIPAKRKPVTISTSLTGSGNVSVTVDDPKLSTVREAINDLMQQEYDVPPANMGFTVEQAYSAQQLDLSLHASYKTGVVNVSGGFDFSKKEVKTRLIARFIQNYYTLDMDLPDNPSDLFAEDVDRSLIGTKMPMYVSSVTFGRLALFTIESSLEETEVKVCLDGSYAAVSGSASAAFDKLIANSTMKVYILGGSGETAGTSINGFSDFKNYIISGGNYSKESPGAPVSYKLRYISDNSIAKIVFSARYPIVTAVPRTDNLLYDVSVWLSKIAVATGAGEGGEAEMYGTISSYPNSDISSNKKHFEYPENNAQQVPDNGAVHNFSDNTTTRRAWNDLKHTDVINVYIELFEDDPDIINADDVYDPATFPTPVTEIVAGVAQATPGQGYSKDMTVYAGLSWAKVTINFTYTTTRTSK